MFAGKSRLVEEDLYIEVEVEQELISIIVVVILMLAWEQITYLLKVEALKLTLVLEEPLHEPLCGIYLFPVSYKD